MLKLTSAYGSDLLCHCCRQERGVYISGNTFKYSQVGVINVMQGGGGGH